MSITRMNIRYKLLNQDLISYGNCKWELFVWKETDGIGELCSSGWLHCYSNPILGLILNPIHANINNPRLFKVEVDGKTLNDNGLKEGWSRMRIIEEMDVPNITLTQKIGFGIYCSLEVYKEKDYVTWANKWLSGEDRTIVSAKAVANAAAYAAYYASDAAAYAAYYASDAAAYAAKSAAYAASDAGYAAANAAAYAIKYTARKNKEIDLISILEKAMKID